MRVLIAKDICPAAGETLSGLGTIAYFHGVDRGPLANDFTYMAHGAHPKTVAAEFTEPSDGRI